VRQVGYYQEFISSVSEPDDFHEINYELWVIFFNFLQSVTTNGACTNLKRQVKQHNLF